MLMKLVKSPFEHVRRNMVSYCDFYEMSQSVNMFDLSQRDGTALSSFTRDVLLRESQIKTVCKNEVEDHETLERIMWTAGAMYGGKIPHLSCMNQS